MLIDALYGKHDVRDTLKGSHQVSIKFARQAIKVVGYF